MQHAPEALYFQIKVIPNMIHNIICLITKAPVVLDHRTKDIIMGYVQNM